jgi:hypothetical protein
MSTCSLPDRNCIHAKSPCIYILLSRSSASKHSLTEYTSRPNKMYVPHAISTVNIHSQAISVYLYSLPNTPASCTNQHPLPHSPTTPRRTEAPPHTAPLSPPKPASDATKRSHAHQHRHGSATPSPTASWIQAADPPATPTAHHHG